MTVCCSLDRMYEPFGNEWFWFVLDAMNFALMAMLSFCSLFRDRLLQLDSYKSFIQLILRRIFCYADLFRLDIFFHLNWVVFHLKATHFTYLCCDRTRNRSQREKFCGSVPKKYNLVDLIVHSGVPLYNNIQLNRIIKDYKNEYHYTNKSEVVSGYMLSHNLSRNQLEWK